MTQEEWRVSARDAKGQSERIWFRTQPWMLRDVAIIVGGKSFPYETAGDLYRHALKRQLDWLAEQLPVPTHITQVEAISLVLMEDADNSAMQALFQKLQEQVTAHIVEGRHDRARELVGRVKNKIALMPPDNPWREIYGQELDKRVGKVLGADQPSLGLLDLVDGTPQPPLPPSDTLI